MPAGRPARLSIRNPRLVGWMLAVSLLLHLGLAALFLLAPPDPPRQPTSPPSIDVIADPTTPADVAADQAALPTPTMGEPDAAEAPPVTRTEEPASAAPTPPQPSPPIALAQEPAPAAPSPPAPAAPSATASPANPEASAPVPPDAAPPTQAPPTQAPPTQAPPTEAPPTPPTQAMEMAPDATAPISPPAPRAPPRVSLDLQPVRPLPPIMPPPPAPPAPPPPRPAAPAFPRPIMQSWQANPLGAPPRPRGNGGIDLALGPVARASRGAPPRGPQDSNAMIRVEGAQVGADWMQLMQEWWVRHRYYPPQAAENHEDGLVQVHLDVDRFGRVHSARVETPSGSQWLDMGALAIFRGANLPPFPQSTPEPRADVHLTINFILIRR